MGLTPDYDGSVRIKDLNSVQQVSDDLQLASDLAGGNTEKISVGQLLSDVTLTGEASGTIASFSDALDASMKSCTVSIAPEQDLHGYDRPWAGGTGKNLLENTYVSTPFATAGTDGSVTLNGTINSTMWITINSVSLKAGTYILSGTPQNAPANTYIYDDSSLGGWNDLDGSGSTKTFSTDVTGVIRIRVNAGTYDNLTFYPMIRLASDTDPTFAPYSNICPITGHDEVTVVVVGKNLFDGEVVDGRYSSDTGEYNPDYSNYRSTAHPIKVVEGEDIYSSLAAYRIYYDAYMNHVSTDVTGAAVVTTPQGACYMHLSQSKSTWTDNLDVMIALSDTSLLYEPYDGHTYTIDLGTTVYYATIDLVTGVMTVWGAMVDLGTLNWNYSTARLKFYASLAGIKSVTALQVGNLLCSRYSVTSADNLNLDDYDGYCATINGNEVQIKDLQYTGSVAFKAAMNGVQLVYELATPYTVQLTPTQVRSLLGSNNVWSDSGEMASVVYVRDINAVIGDILQRLEALEPSRSAKSVEAPAEEEKPEEEALAEEEKPEEAPAEK